MLAWARSTGAMLPCCSFLSASGSSRLSSLRNWRRVVEVALSGRGRQTKIMDDARALVPIATERLLSSVFIGKVPLMLKLDLISPSSMVSHPVEEMNFSSS